MWGHALSRVAICARVLSVCYWYVFTSSLLQKHKCKHAYTCNLQQLTNFFLPPSVCMESQTGYWSLRMDPHSHTQRHMRTHLYKKSQIEIAWQTLPPQYAHTHTHFLKGSQTTHKVCMVATESGLGCACVCTRASVCVLEVASIQTRAQLFIHHSVDGVLSSSNGLKSPTPPTHTPVAPNTLCTSATN